MASGDVSIREGRPADEREIRAMYEWLFAAPGVRPLRWDPDAALERLNEAIVAPQSTILVAEGEGALIGFCTAYVEFSSVRFGRRCWVEDLAVDPEHRSLGVGAALLAAAREWGRGWTGPGWSGAPGADIRPGIPSRDAPAAERSTPRLARAPARGSVSPRTAAAGTPVPDTTPCPGTTPAPGRAHPALGRAHPAPGRATPVGGRAHPGWRPRGAARTGAPAGLCLRPPATPSATLDQRSPGGFPPTPAAWATHPLDVQSAGTARGWHSLAGNLDVRHYSRIYLRNTWS